MENPQDIIVRPARRYGQRAVLKFAQYTGAHPMLGGTPLEPSLINFKLLSVNLVSSF